MVNLWSSIGTENTVSITSTFRNLAFSRRVIEISVRSIQRILSIDRTFGDA